MNTSKQVNAMIGLLMVGAIATLLYYLWDGERQSAATERQLTENAERGGRLFSLNCRACHGLTGMGSLESRELPGAALNTDQNREADAARQTYLKQTIRCGRVGTRMPPWAIENGGSLNDFQIEQLMALITGQMAGFDQDPQASVEGWNHAIEEGNHADEFAPPKHLEEAISASEETLVLDNPIGMSRGVMLRIDDGPEDEIYEVVEVVDAPASSVLDESVDADATELVVQEPYVFEAGDILMVEDELVEVVEAPARAFLVEDVPADATTLRLDDVGGLEEGQIVTAGVEKMRVAAVSGDTLEVERGVEETEAVAQVAETPVIVEGDRIAVERGSQNTEAASHEITRAVVEIGNEITVERGTFGTEAAEHEAGTEVFNGPITPPDAITGAGEGNPPCGQLPAQVEEEGGGEPVDVTGTLDMTMGDNFFDAGGTRNPTLNVPVNTAVTINLTNEGNAVHNVIVAGPDNEFDTDDDFISDPDTIAAGESGTLGFTLTEAGTYDYHCQFHVDQMSGQVTVQ
jgi:mono/diheme cytochrome c family protein